MLKHCAQFLRGIRGSLSFGTSQSCGKEVVPVRPLGSPSWHLDPKAKSNASLSLKEQGRKLTTVQQDGSSLALSTEASTCKSLTSQPLPGQWFSNLGTSKSSGSM